MIIFYILNNIVFFEEIHILFDSLSIASFRVDEGTKTRVGNLVKSLYIGFIVNDL